MIKVLIVEDEKPIANLIRLSLNKEGYACTCAFDGLAAVDLLEKNIYDLILLDVMLPHVDGFELLEYIRPLEVPVIFINRELGTSKMNSSIFGEAVFGVIRLKWNSLFHKYKS